MLHRKNRSRKKFLSTPSARRATNIPAGAYQNGEFLSTPSARRATKLWGRSCRFHLISIHALREESDLLHLFIQPSRPLFLSTPSARRATPLLTLPCIWCYISIHALREESDLQVRCPCGGCIISIHALREESDGSGEHDHKTFELFLSTPSARRATSGVFDQVRRRAHFYPRPPRGERQDGTVDVAITAVISIHALREESDGQFLPGWRFFTNFYPRPPRGERPALFHRYLLPEIHFYPRPPRGERRRGRRPRTRPQRFLSTPSARRATAKTERKHPAFVSLYTSLHKLQRDVCKPNRKITSLLAQTAGIPVRSVPGNHVCCRFALARHQKISTLSWANSGCSPMCSTLVW